MKKHPIDELFMKELGNYELEPSKQAKELFQKRLEEKNKRGVGRWFVKSQQYYWWAASVVLLLGVGWWGFSEQTSTQTEVAQLTPKTEKNENIAIKPTTSITVDNGVIAKKNVRKNRKPNLNLENKVPQPERIEKIMPMVVIDEPIQDELTLAITKAQNRKNEKEREQRREQNRSDKLFNESVGETMIVITEVVPQEKTILIPEIDGDSPVSIARAEREGKTKIEMNNSFLAKVYTGFKQLKHGEKVNLTLLSKEDQRDEQLFVLEDEGFIKQEQSEIKAKFTTIKRLFNKNKN